jgi:anti-anti-sigma factor
VGGVAKLPVGELEIEEIDDVVVVRLHGEHDLSSAPSLCERLRAFASQDCGVAVDVGEVEFVDLAVVRALLVADEALRARGRRLALLFGTSCPVKRLLELTGTQEMFACAEDRDRAIALARATTRRGQQDE